MSRQFFRNSLLAVLPVVLLAGTSYAAMPDKNAREPVVVTAGRMEADELGKQVMFTGSVMLKKEGMILSSDSMIVYYDPSSRDIREIEALGNVVVNKDGRVAVSNHASYLSREEKIILTGDARIMDNENQLGGTKIILYMRDDRSIVEGGKVLLYQDKVEKKTDSIRRK